MRRSILSMSEVEVMNEPACEPVFEPVFEPGAPGFTDVKFIGSP